MRFAESWLLSGAPAKYSCHKLSTNFVVRFYVHVCHNDCCWCRMVQVQLEQLRSRASACSRARCKKSNTTIVIIN